MNRLEKSGIDISKFSTHNSRRASTSKAFRNGIKTEIIRSTAGWTHKV